MTLISPHCIDTSATSGSEHFGGVVPVRNRIERYRGIVSDRSFITGGPERRSKRWLCFFRSRLSTSLRGRGSCRPGHRKPALRGEKHESKKLRGGFLWTSRIHWLWLPRRQTARKIRRFSSTGTTTPLRNFSLRFHGVERSYEIICQRCRDASTEFLWCQMILSWRYGRK